MFELVKVCSEDNMLLCYSVMCVNMQGTLHHLHGIVCTQGDTAETPYASVMHLCLHGTPSGGCMHADDTKQLHTHTHTFFFFFYLWNRQGVWQTGENSFKSNHLLCHSDHSQRLAKANESLCKFGKVLPTALSSPSSVQWDLHMKGERWANTHRC